MLYLASKSSIRLQLLRQAGVDTTVVTTSYVENHTADTDVPIATLPMYLATEKARGVVPPEADALILGSDQILVVDDRVQHKPESVAEAHQQLRRLRGKPHNLITAAVLLRNGEVVSQIQDNATVTLRPYSDRFLESYMASIDPHVLMSVGCYQLEGRGVQLMEKIDGDHFTILGLPLLQVLAALRDCGELQS